MSTNDGIKKEVMAIYAHENNSCVVQHPGRTFPGVLIQGDSLFVLFDHAMTVCECLQGKGDKETFLAALELAKLLESHVQNYEEALAEKGIRLPYSRDTGRNTDNFCGKPNA